MNKIIQKFSHPASFGFLFAGVILVAGTVLGGSTAHAWFCNGNTSSSPCGTITTIVNVVNTGGGTANPSNFNVSLFGSLDPATTTFKGSASGTVENIDPENYQVTVSPKTNYEFTYSSDCTGTLNAGDSKTCTVTATYCPPTVTPPSADISISKTADVTSTESGGTVNYTVVVTDNGPATSTGVTATDTLPSGMTFVSASTSAGSYSSSTGAWNVGTLSNGQSATLVITATANTVTASTTVTNTATVAESASETDPNTANNIASVSICVEPCPTITTPTSTPTSTPVADLSIVKTVDNATPSAGDTINYTLTVTASGPATSTGVVATDTLPSGLTFENATASVGTYATSTGTWTIGDMSASSTATLNIAALVDASDTANQAITNFANVGETPSSTNQTGNSSSSVTVTVQGNNGGGGGCTSNCGVGPTGGDVDLSIVKTVDNSTPTPGATVNFTVTVTDNGPGTGTFVYAEDQLPSGTSFISATTSQGGYNMTSGNWNIGTLAPNATATLTIAAEVSPTEAVGTTITNTATVSSTLGSLVDPNLANNSSSVTLTVTSSGGGGCTSNCGGGGGSVQANIGIVKTVDNSTPATGATINYTLTVTDGGPSDSFGVVASDILPTGITFDSASSSEGSYNSSTGIWTVGAVANGQSATLVITATVTASAGTTITNIGTVSENPGILNATPGNTSSSVSITVAGGGNGGGGGGGGGGNGGGGGGGGQVLGASTSTGQVLGASCGLYLTQYIHPIRKDLNDPTEVKKLQVFLNQNLGLNIPVTGYYGNQTIAAVNEFQTKYHDEVLAPWVPLGLPTQFTPTSYVYQTTQRWINLIMCPPLNIPEPALHVDNGE